MSLQIGRPGGFLVEVAFSEFVGEEFIQLNGRFFLTRPSGEYYRTSLNLPERYYFVLELRHARDDAPLYVYITQGSKTYEFTIHHDYFKYWPMF